jgi:hypothetical protein
VPIKVKKTLVRKKILRALLPKFNPNLRRIGHNKRLPEKQEALLNGGKGNINANLSVSIKNNQLLRWCKNLFPSGW